MTLEWIISTCFLIFVTLILRAALGSRMNARFRYALWALVLIRLLVPVQLFTSPILGISVSDAPEILRRPSIYVLPVQTIPLEEASNVSVGENGQITDGNSFGYPKLGNDGKTVVRYADKLSPLQVLKILWFLGGIVTAFVLLACNLQFAARLRRVRKPLEATGWPVKAYTAEGLPSPCLFGLLNPAVYVTANAASNPDMLRHVMAHETTHLRHLDHLWSFLRGIALAIHWWNPLVWLAAIYSRRDGELACDEGALELLGAGERAAYGETLLSLVTAKPGPRDLLCCATTMSGEKRSLWERIRRIACKPKQLVSVVIAVIIVLSITVACAFGRAEAKDASGPDMYDNTTLTLSRQPDLNRDGIAETVQILEKSGNTPEWRLEFNQEDGNAVLGVWSDTLDETHSGCNTYFLYQEDGADYILEYRPKMQQGQCTYSYRLFHIEDGKEVTDRKNSVEFDINFNDSLHKFDPAEIVAFMEEVNGIIGQSELIFTTDVWMLNLKEDANGLYDDILSALNIPDSAPYRKRTLEETLSQYQTDMISEIGAVPQAEILPCTPDFDHDGKPEQLQITTGPGGMSWGLKCTGENGQTNWTLSDYAYSAHAGWKSLFLCRKDGKDYLLQYGPTMYGGDCDYWYMLLDLAGDDINVIESDSVQFDINFNAEGHKFDPKKISVFMDKINGLLADSVQLLNTNQDLLGTFEKNGRLYDNLWWIEEYDESLSLLENLLVYRNSAIEDAAVVDVWNKVNELLTDETRIAECITDMEGAIRFEKSDIASALSRGAAVMRWESAEDTKTAYLWQVRIQHTLTPYQISGDKYAILLEAGEREGTVRITFYGTVSVMIYSENPLSDGQYIHDVPYSLTRYAEDADLYKLVRDKGVNTYN